MAAKSQRSVIIYDPVTGKRCRLDSLIRRLGTEAVAEKFKVTPSTVSKWLKNVHKPAKKTIFSASKRFL